MPRTSDPTDIPRRLTDAGYLLFNRHGYNATGIQQITDQAGVPKGSFYNHFGSKEAFAAQIIRHYADWVDQAWDQCLSDAPSDALGTIRHTFARFVEHHARTECQGCLVGNFAAEVAESSAPCREVLQTSLDAWRVRLADLIERAQAEGSMRRDLPPHTLSLLFWDAWEGALLRMKIERHTGPLSDTVALLLDHLLAPCASAAVRHPGGAKQQT
ncbi:TetR/AcrR family transcriptional regulator [Aquabacterium sp. UBA2148]|uniref:TetR/AcrR family transcriptional regulator n=1 Tax=Aquabacterium sp. UBA2148 TaxID=1946042 RepID=UPI00257E618A|nr:TetR/AcrR family transcriptional regulator [Aquabacterium sp. UBA2148]